MNWRQLVVGPLAMLAVGAVHCSGAVQFPVESEIVPGELKARIYLHDVQAQGRVVSCWSYVTEGLARHKQREIIFTLQRGAQEKPEDYPREPLKFFQTLLDLAKEGRVVGAGGYSKLRGAGFLGFPGLFYMEPVWLPPEEPKEACLAMVVLTSDEVEALVAFGPTRVLNILGKAERLYPVPYWSERGRSSRLVFDAMRQNSILSKVHPLIGGGLRVLRENERLILRSHVGRGKRMALTLNELPENTPLVFVTEIDPSADGALVWQPGQKQPEAIAPPGSRGQRLAGAFVIFLPEQEVDRVEIIEDGYTLSLKHETWQKLRQALFAEQDLETDIVSLTWLPEGVELYLPPGGVPPQTGPVRVRQVELGQPNTEPRDSIPVEALAAHIRAIEDTVTKRFAGLKATGELRVTCEIRPGSEAKYNLASRSGFPDATLQSLSDDLRKLAPPDVKRPVNFAIEFEMRQ